MSVKKNKKTSLILSLFLVFGILGPVQSGKGESKPSQEEIDAEKKREVEQEAKRKREAEQEAKRKREEEAKRKRDKLNQEKLDKAKDVVKEEQKKLASLKTQLDQATQKNTDAKNKSTDAATKHESASQAYFARYQIAKNYQHKDQELQNLDKAREAAHKKSMELYAEYLSANKEYRDIEGLHDKQKEDTTKAENTVNTLQKL